MHIPSMDLMTLIDYYEAQTHTTIALRRYREGGIALCIWHRDNTAEPFDFKNADEAKAWMRTRAKELRVKEMT